MAHTISMGNAIQEVRDGALVGRGSHPAWDWVFNCSEDRHSLSVPTEPLSPSLGEVPVLSGPGPVGLCGTVQVVLGFAHCLAKIQFPCPLSTSCLLSVSKNVLLLILYSPLSLGFYCKKKIIYCCFSGVLRRSIDKNSCTYAIHHLI